jgi:hypothetical protein
MSTPAEQLPAYWWLLAGVKKGPTPMILYAPIPRRQCPACGLAHPAPTFVTAVYYHGLRGEPDGVGLMCPDCRHLAPGWRFRMITATMESVL